MNQASDRAAEAAAQVTQGGFSSEVVTARVP
jgi:hypothetical protein